MLFIPGSDFENHCSRNSLPPYKGSFKFPEDFKTRQLILLAHKEMSTKRGSEEIFWKMSKFGFMNFVTTILVSQRSFYTSTSRLCSGQFKLDNKWPLDKWALILSWVVVFLDSQLPIFAVFYHAKLTNRTSLNKCSQTSTCVKIF